MAEHLTLDEVRRLRVHNELGTLRLAGGPAERVKDAAEVHALLDALDWPYVSCPAGDGDYWWVEGRRGNDTVTGSGDTLLDALREAHGGDDGE